MPLIQQVQKEVYQKGLRAGYKPSEISQMIAELPVYDNRNLLRLLKQFEMENSNVHNNPR